MTNPTEVSPRTRDAGKTREKILDAAQDLILDHGYGATTVDAVVARAGITKGAFFHHYGSKAELARALVDRYAALDREHLQARLERARKLATDPLQQVLVLIGLYEEDFEALPEPFPGCLFASYIYENKLFDADTLAVLRESTLRWREVMRGMLERVVAAHPPRIPVDVESLADVFYALIEGSFIMTKTLGDKTLLPRHTQHLRNYLQLLFGSR
ncbi:MAG TPA: TetR/AcrR family transcriptional regulator [Myxococcota bacterium]|nr:TetR/AcrR family transcriptional regulator [Myxococcota bacterium]